MKEVDFFKLKVGDVVYDTVSKHDFTVREVTAPNEFREGFVRFERTDVVTIYGHSSHTIIKY